MSQAQRLFHGGAVQRIQALILGGLLAAAFAPTLGEMAREWFKHPEYGHGVFMAPVAAWMVWDRRRQLASLRRNGYGVGLALAAGLLLVPLGVALLLGEMKLSWFLKPFAFIGALAACIAILYGRQGLRELAKPLVVLAMMCPIPWRVLVWMTLPLKRHATVLATGLIDLSGLQASLQGNLIHAPGMTTMWIADQCSGVRSLVSLLSVAVIGCLFWKRHWLVKLVVLVSCIPIAVIVNSLRIWVTAMLSVHVSPQLAQGFFHVCEGFVLFGVAALVLLAWAVLLHRLLPRAAGAAAPRPERLVVSVRRDRPVARGLAVACAALALALSAVGVYRIRDSVDGAARDEAAVARMQRTLKALPLDLEGGTYRGVALDWNADAVAASGADAYGAVRYEGEDGRDYQIFVGGAVRNADNFHSPNVCMPTAGWEVLADGNVPLTAYASARSTPEMRRLLLQRGDEQMLTYFWFQAGDRLADSEWGVRIHRLLDMVRGEPLRPIMIVSIYVPVRDGIEQTEEAAQRFLSTLAPRLREVTTSGGIYG